MLCKNSVESFPFIFVERVDFVSPLLGSDSGVGVDGIASEGGHRVTREGEQGEPGRANVCERRRVSWGAELEFGGRALDGGQSRGGGERGRTGGMGVGKRGLSGVVRGCEGCSGLFRVVRGCEGF